MSNSIKQLPSSVTVFDQVLSEREPSVAALRRRIPSPNAASPGTAAQNPPRCPRNRVARERNSQPADSWWDVWGGRLWLAGSLIIAAVIALQGIPGSPIRSRPDKSSRVAAMSSHAQPAEAVSGQAASDQKPTGAADAGQGEEIVSIGGKSYRVVRKNIEDVRPGNTVLAQDPNTGELVAKSVSQSFRRVTNHLRILEITGSGGGTQTIETTDEHPFWVQGRGWVNASQLVRGDMLRQSDGQFATVASSRRDEHLEGVPVYNFEVEGLHNYFVARSSGDKPLLVHNANCGSLRLGQEALEHIVQRHWPTSGAGGAGKFAHGLTGRELRSMITEAAANGARRPGKFGRTLIEHDFGRIIGTEIGGGPTSWLRVVIDSANDVVTAFPF